MTLDRVADLDTTELEAIRRLTAAVYPPEIWADWPGYLLEWSPKEWCVRIRDAASELKSHVGMVIRDGTFNRRAKRIGGIGSVMTHPDHRNLGYANESLQKALGFFRQQGDINFVVLVCEPKMLDFYAGFGFREFTGKMLVRQFGEIADFTFLRIMTLRMKSTGPISGVLDLCGPAW